jgi:hypothetical protein
MRLRGANVKIRSVSTAAYRESVVAAPGVVFHTVRGVAIGFLGLVASLAALQCIGQRVGVYCSDHWEAATCAQFDPGPLADAIGAPDELQRAIVRFPPSAAAFSIVVALASILLLRPITVLIDPSTRTLLIRSGRWPRRVRTTRIRLEDVDTIEVHGIAGALFAVRVIDVRGATHALTGHRLSHARANAIATAIQSATA